MLSAAADLLSNASATGAAVTWPGGKGVFTVVGSFSAGTVSLQFLGPDGTTWIDVGTSTTVTAAACAAFELPQGQLRASVSGGTPSGLYARVARVLV